MRSCSKIILLLVILVIFLPSISNAYFVSTPSRYKNYDVNGIIINSITHGNYIYALIQDTTVPQCVTFAQINKENKNALVRRRSVFIDNTPGTYIYPEDIKFISNFIWVSGHIVYEHEDMSITYHLFRIKIDSNLQYYEVKVGIEWLIDYPTNAVITAIGEDDNIYIVANRLDVTPQTIKFYCFDAVAFNLKWEKEWGESYSLNLADIEVKNNYLYIAANAIPRPKQYDFIKKYNNQGIEVDQICMSAPEYSSHEGTHNSNMKVSDIGEIVLVNTKSSYIMGGTDKLSVKYFNSIGQYVRRYNYEINGQIISSSISFLENDIYIATTTITMEEWIEFPYWRYDDAITMLYSFRTDEQRVNKILNVAERDIYNDSWPGGVNCIIYTRDEVQLESMPYPISQKRLAIFDSFHLNWVNDDRVDLTDYWIPKDTLRNIHLKGDKLLNFKCLGVENGAELSYQFFLQAAEDPNGIVVGLDCESFYSPLLLESDMGYVITYSGEDTTVNVMGKEILTWTYISEPGCSVYRGFGSYPGYVLGMYSLDPIPLVGFNSDTQELYMINGARTIVNDGYLVQPVPEPYIFVVDQTEE